ncbi:hypothetical protein FOL47_008587 [Perkinsus chesapeaki]|uniref:Solute carrier 38 member n=1 Tax=Perkinsus chesapeaki TaxID=330153 RepID=A0A7J6LCZ4_PERCH|nr:hypothetical protein FOL47_008587 [Perkinsus chesapeaki]
MATSEFYSPSELTVATTVPDDIPASLDIDTDVELEVVQPPLAAPGKVSAKGAVCKRMERGISLRSFIFMCINALTTIGLSVPFMFTTVGILSIPIQAVTAASVYLCIKLVSKTLQNDKVITYALEKDVPPFEREYTFLAEVSGGKLGRRIASLTIFLEYFMAIIGLVAAMGITTHIIVDSVSVEWWIVVFSFISLLLIIFPYMKEITNILAVLAVVTLFGGLGLWVTAGILVHSTEPTQFGDNLHITEPYALNFFTAIALSIWNSGAAPSLPPFYGCVRGVPAGIVPKWLIYTACVLLLVRMIAFVPCLMVPVMEKFSTTAVVAGSIFWRLLWRCLLVSIIALLAVLARSQLAYFQAVGGILLTACSARPPATPMGPMEISQPIMAGGCGMSAGGIELMRFPASEVPLAAATVSPAPTIDYSYLIREHDIAIPSTMPPDTTAKDLPTTVPPYEFWLLKAIDRSVNIMDYWDATEHQWDMDGLVDDLHNAREERAAAVTTTEGSDQGGGMEEEK